LRGMVPPPLHHRALRRSRSGRGSRHRGGGGRRRADGDRQRPLGRRGTCRRPAPHRSRACRRTGPQRRPRRRRGRDSCAAGGAVDVLVNNAGANFPGGRDEWEPDTFAVANALNLTGPMRLTVGCQALLAKGSLDGGASVISMVSASAFRSVPLVPGYAAAKAGLMNLTGNLAAKWL